MLIGLSICPSSSSGWVYGVCQVANLPSVPAAQLPQLRHLKVPVEQEWPLAVSVSGRPGLGSGAGTKQERSWQGPPTLLRGEMFALYFGGTTFSITFQCSQEGQKASCLFVSETG